MKKQKRRIMMDLETFQRAVLMAQAGIGNRAIKRDTGLSDSQVTYRCHYYKTGMGFKEGLRVRWRNGHSPLLQQFLDDCAGIMALEFERKFLPRFVHPEMKFSPIKEPKAPTVDEAVAILKRKKAGF